MPRASPDSISGDVSMAIAVNGTLVFSSVLLGLGDALPPL